ncbi:MAG: four helix bundle protein [Bacteroidales bacterium]|jgi:four helix bundle protein
MATVKRFEDLEVWKKARELNKIIYQVSGKGEFAKDFELKKQERKSSGSIMDNIAEGFERGGRGEFIQFLGISKGSAGELRSQNHRAFDVNYISNDEFKNINTRCIEISQMIQGLMDYLQNSEIKGTKYKKCEQL